MQVFHFLSTFCWIFFKKLFCCCFGRSGSSLLLWKFLLLQSTGSRCTGFSSCSTLLLPSSLSSVGPGGRQPTRLLRPWDFLGKSTGVGCHCLLRIRAGASSNAVPWARHHAVVSALTTLLKVHGISANVCGMIHNLTVTEPGILCGPEAQATGSELALLLASCVMMG